MPVIRYFMIIGSAIAAFLLSFSAHAGEARIAAAANFAGAAHELADAFEAQSGHRVSFSFASTGQLYAQIAQGAPYDAFLAADQARAERAVSAGFARQDSRFTYAFGRLALFSLDPALATGEDALRGNAFNKIAIANPKTAPYGTAAMETLHALGLESSLKKKLVYGASIAQTYQFVATGNAEIGIVALSQIAGHENGSRWIIPEGLHARLAQDGVLLKRGADNEAAIAFLAFMKSAAGRSIIAGYGYRTPHAGDRDG